jgi:hypothetical protein
MRMQISRWLGWAGVVFAIVSLALVIVDFTMAQKNRTLQAEVNQRQTFINESLQLNRVNEALIRTIASVAVNDKDDALRAILSKNGISVSVRSAPSGAAPAAPAEGSGIVQSGEAK